jgi:hypothetical protein
MDNKESYIVRNVTRGPVYVTDLKLAIDPLAVADLTFWDNDQVKASADLRNSLKQGLLRKITVAEAEELSDIRIAKMKQSSREDIYEEAEETARVRSEGGEDFDAVPLNLSRNSKADTERAQKEVRTAGSANNHLAYAQALDIAQAQAESRGRTLTVDQFADMVENDRELVANILKQHTAYEHEDEQEDSGMTYLEQTELSGAVPARKRGRPKGSRNKPKAEPKSDPEVIDLTNE